MKVFLKAVVDYAFWFHILGVLGIMFCLRSAFLARRERERSIYTLEKEAATSKEFRVLTIGLAIAGGMGVVLFLTAAVAPQVTFVEVAMQEETPAALILPTVTPTQVESTATPTATPTRFRPTALPVIAYTQEPVTAVPTSTPPLPPPLCPNSVARLTAPDQNAILSGAAQIMGSANPPNFDYYKVEIAQAAKPDQWALITDLRRSPIAGGLLDMWDTTAFPNGRYRLRLVVVDITGNYPEPCEIGVEVTN
jgi:hypothetical protein